MGTGVSHRRIGTGSFVFQVCLPFFAFHLTELRSLSRLAKPANTVYHPSSPRKIHFPVPSCLPACAGSLKSSTVYKTLTSSSLERRWSSRTFRYGYLVTTSPQLSDLPSAAPSFVRSPTSGISDSHGVTGGVYKTRERIHRSILICDY